MIGQVLNYQQLYDQKKPRSALECGVKELPDVQAVSFFIYLHTDGWY